MRILCPEQFFVSENNAPLRVKITDKDGNVKYETENVDDIEQNEALVYYLDAFRDDLSSTLTFVGFFVLRGALHH